MAILKIAQIDRVRLQANVGEKDLPAIRAGTPVTVTAAGAGQAPVTARVTSVAPFVDQGPRTAVVEALVDNAGRRFLPGQYVTMQFVTGSRSAALTVPLGAVSRLGGAAKVWIARDGRAEPRAVTTGLENPERVEIVTGLTGAEKVIARGHDGLYAGARVTEVSAGAAPRAPGPDKDMPGMTEPTSPPRPAPTGHEEMPGMKGPAAPPAPRPKEGPHAGH
jgi:RND family efflux transporter MFP subunit